MDLEDRDDTASDGRDKDRPVPDSGNAEASDNTGKKTENSPKEDVGTDSWYENGRFYHRGENNEPDGSFQGTDNNYQNQSGNRQNYSSGYQNSRGQYNNVSQNDNGLYNDNGYQNRGQQYNGGQNGNYQNNGFGGGMYGNNYQQAPPNGMATAAMILGIISLVTSCCFYLAIPLGVIGVILAVLSQGSEHTLSPRAKSGLWLAVAGAALSLFLTVASVASTFSRYGVDGFMNMLKQYEQFYEGQSGHDGNSNYNDMKDWLDDYLNGKNDSRSRKIEQRENDTVL